MIALLRRLTNQQHERSGLTVLPSPYDERVLLLRFFSHTLGIYKQLHVYLPPEARPCRPVPALYLLRGHEREWLNRQEDATRDGSNAVDVVERLRREGLIAPLALVMPGLSSDDNALSGVLTNFLAPELAAGKSGIGSGRFEDYFVDELLPLLERLFPLRAERAVAGFSLGGAMAVKIAAQHPTLFRSVSAYDGTFLYAEGDGEAVRADDSVLRNPLFDAVLGVPRNLAYAASQSPVNLVLRGHSAQLRALRWAIQYGPESIEPWGSNFYRGEHLVAALRRKGIEPMLPPVVADGDHTWRTADRHLAATLPIHSAALAHAPGS